LARLEDGERLADVLPLTACEPGYYVTMATAEGKVKRVEVTDVEGIGRQATVIMGLGGPTDRLVRALLTEGGGELMATTAAGKTIRFGEDEVSVQGLPATGVKGVSLADNDDALVDLDMATEGGQLVVLTANGFAKRTRLGEFGAQGRGGQGAYCVDSGKDSLTGPVVGARVALPGEQVLFCTRAGTMARVALEDVPSLRRASWGRVVTRTRRGAVIAVAENDVAEGVVRLATRSDAAGTTSNRDPSDSPPSPEDQAETEPEPLETVRSTSKRGTSRTGGTSSQKAEADQETKVAEPEAKASSSKRSNRRRRTTQRKPPSRRAHRGAGDGASD